MNRPGYVDVDSLQARITLEQAAEKCGVTLDTKGSGPEVRIDCPFNCTGDHSGRKEVAVNTANPQKVFLCHSYQCQFRGNLLTLMHGWLTGNKPTGGKLKGDEFQRIKKVLAASEPVSPASTNTPKVETEKPAPPRPVNVALIDSADEKVRELANIDSKFVTDVAVMNPAAASYVRKHPALTPEAMRKWRCGYLPNDGGGDKRGWSLRGGLVYPVFSESCKVLAWVGRDFYFEEKEREYSHLAPVERKGQLPPAKHRFPKGFHRGLELYGQQASRLQETGYREFIAKHGLVVVEGFNDVIALDIHSIPALGLMSNRMTEAQAEKIARYARQLASGRVNLLFDCNDTGVEGAKDAVWQFAQRQLDVRVAWTQTSHAGTFAGREPESLTRDDLLTLLRVESN
ncbi:MAG: hypothetical protein U0798_04500 [Gemmataceae bacterium]